MQNPVSVFITTQSAKGRFGKWMDLSEYKNARDFHRSAMIWAKTFIDNDYIITDVRSSIDVSRYINDNRVDDDLWYYVDSIMSDLDDPSWDVPEHVARAERQEDLYHLWAREY